MAPNPGTNFIPDKSLKFHTGQVSQIRNRISLSNLIPDKSLEFHTKHAGQVSPIPYRTRLSNFVLDKSLRYPSCYSSLIHLHFLYILHISMAKMKEEKQAVESSAMKQLSLSLVRAVQRYLAHEKTSTTL